MLIMKNTKITRKTIDNAIRVMVANATSYKTFVADFYAYVATLSNTNYVLTWNKITDVFEIFNVHTKKSTFLDFSHVMGNLD